jgi:hypothetical protein
MCQSRQGIVVSFIQMMNLSHLIWLDKFTPNNW